MTKNRPCGIQFMRSLLLLWNIIFLLIGIGLVGIGIYIKVDNNFATILDKLTTISDFKGQALGYLAFIMIGGGIFTLLLALLGCMGSLWHSRCLLYLYAAILAVLMILEFVGCILAFTYKNKLEDVYNTSLTNVFVDALDHNKTDVLAAFHQLETSVKCCGVNGINDYIQHGKDAPLSCYQNPKGCSRTIIDLLEKNLPIIGGTLGGILLLEIFGLILAIILARALKNCDGETFSSSPGEVLPNLISTRRANYRKF